MNALAALGVFPNVGAIVKKRVGSIEYNDPKPDNDFIYTSMY